MPVETTDHMFKVFYPEGVNPLPSHQYLWRIMADLHDSRDDKILLEKKSLLLIKVLVLALNVTNNTLDIEILRTYYDEGGHPRDLDMVLDLEEKYPKSCDGIDKMSVYCSIDEQFEFVFVSERRRDDNSRYAILQNPRTFRQLNPQYGNFRINPHVPEFIHPSH